MYVPKKLSAANIRFQAKGATDCVTPCRLQNYTGYSIAQQSLMQRWA
jgi:hypothetical protein